MDTPNVVGRAWDKALASDRQISIDAITDPDVPPLPPHMSFDEARAYASALVKGDPNERGVIRQTFREMIDAVLPHKN